MPQPSFYSDDFLRELEPYYRIEIDGVALPPDLAKQVEFLRLEESEGNKATFEMVVRDYDGSHFEDPLFELQQTVVVFAGYRSAYEERGPFEITLVEEEHTEAGIKLKLKGEEGGQLARKVSRRVFTGGSVLDTFLKVAAEHGLAFSEEDTEDLDTPVTPENPLVQAGESAGKFLQGVAADFGWTLSVTNGRIHLRPATPRDSLGKTILRYNRADGSISKLTAKRKKPRVSYIPISDATPSGKVQPVEADQRHPVVQYGDTLLAIGENASKDREQIVADFEEPILEAEILEDRQEVLRLKRERLRLFKASLDEQERQQNALKDKEAQRQAMKDRERRLVGKELQLAQFKGRGFVTGVGDVAFKDETANFETIRTRVSTQDGRVISRTRLIPSMRINPTTGKKEYFTAEERLGEGDEPSGEIFDPSDPDASLADKDAKKVAKRKVIREGRLESVSVTLKLGNMSFRIQKRLEIEGSGEKTDGEYRVTKAVHVWSGAYTTDLELKRPKPVKKEKDQLPSGFELNENGQIRLKPAGTGPIASMFDRSVFTDNGDEAAKSKKVLKHRINKRTGKAEAFTVEVKC